MKYGVVGSRDFDNLKLVRDFVSRLNEDDVVVSGGARGVDKTAARAARSRGLHVIEHIPDWEKLGKSAGYVRNKDIVNDCDVLVAFWDGRSRGTMHSILLARKAKKKVFIVDEEGTVTT